MRKILQFLETLTMTIMSSSVIRLRILRARCLVYGLLSSLLKMSTSWSLSLASRNLSTLYWLSNQQTEDAKHFSCSQTIIFSSEHFVIKMTDKCFPNKSVLRTFLQHFWWEHIGCARSVTDMARLHYSGWRGDHWHGSSGLRVKLTSTGPLWCRVLFCEPSEERKLTLKLC